MMRTYIFYMVTGFLAGSIPFSLLLPKLFYQIDIRENSRDGNPGSANAMKQAGVALGLVCMLCDVGKGFLPVYSSTRCLSADRLWFSFILLAPVLGHAFSPFLKGRGGKAIAVTFGVLLGVFSIYKIVLILAVVLIVFTFFFQIQPTHIRIILGMLLLCGAVALFYGAVPVTFGVGMISAVVILRQLMDKTFSPAEFRIRSCIGLLRDFRKKKAED